MKREPSPTDIMGREKWVDPCAWGGIRDSLDAILCKLLIVVLYWLVMITPSLLIPLRMLPSTPPSCRVVIYPKPPP